MPKNAIKLRRIYHRGSFRIGVFYPAKNYEVTLLCKQMGMRYSKTKRCWHFDEGIIPFKTLFDGLVKYGYVDYKNINELLSEEELIAFHDNKVSKKKRLKLVPFNTLHPGLRDAFIRFDKILRAEGLSPVTCKSYLHCVAMFFSAYKDRNPDSLSVSDAKEFISEEVVKTNYSNSSHRQFVASLRRLFKDVLEREEAFGKLVLPRRDKKNPTVLSEEEVMRLLIALKNLKHRMAAAMLYSCGLRIGELIRLRVADIDTERMMVFIEQSKGRKDRSVSLPHAIKPLLDNYLETYKPVKYLLNGHNSLQYSTVSIRKVIREAAKRAKIKKTVTPHTLRHSYATHMLENGTDVRFIQNLLGHSSLETTMIYTHISKTDSRLIESPLDTLARKSGRNQLGGGK